MQHILVIGAGRSTSSLIEYLLRHAQPNDWHITVADRDVQLASAKVAAHERGSAVALDVTDEIARLRLISKADIVVSMLPAHMHYPVALDCIGLSKHMVTASYVSEEVQKLDKDAREAGVVLLNEVGVDPGIDHLSAMKVIDEIRNKGGEMLLFESFTGGLPAPGSDDNPWKYKFTWNPRNVVLAGSGGAVKFIHSGHYKYIPYHRVFRRTEIIEIPEYGRFEGYANRDSLKYREVYGLQGIPTIYRGTLRRPGYCRAWNVFVALGMTDDSYKMEASGEMTYRQFVNTFLPYHPTDSVELKLMHSLHIPQDSDLMEKIEWLGLLEDEPIGLENASPAEVLQKRLEEKWRMAEDDKDMIVMYHKFGFRLNGEKRMLESSMVCLGEDGSRTAMSKTVGLPVGIATRFIAEGVIQRPGIQLPINKEVYVPMLEELAEYDIRFTEKEVPFVV
mgnify:CR=1 FL=1